MYKLVTLGACAPVIAASAIGQGMHARDARAQIACPQNLVILPGRGYGMCGHRLRVRDPRTGPIKAIAFWRLQRLSNSAEDRP